MVEEQLAVMIENCNNVTGAARHDKAAEPLPSGVS